MIKFIKKYRLHHKAMALLAAILIWVYVMGVQNLEITTEISRIPVGFVGESVMMEERGLVLLSGKDQTVSLTLRGNRNSLVRLSRDNISIEVNLDSVVTSGSVNVRYTVLLPESGVTIIDRSPGYITLKADKISKKTVPVKAGAQGALPEGYALGQSTVSPSFVTLEGPSEQLKDIAAAMVTIDVTGAKNTLNRSLDYVFVNQAGEVQSFPLIKHDSELISVSQKINMVKTLPLRVNVIEGGFALERNADITILPDTVTLAGDPSIMATMEEFNIGSVYLADISEETTEIEFPIILPEGMQMVEGPTEARVRVKLTDIVEKTFPATQVRITDQVLPSNFQVVTPVLIDLKGDAQLINQITGKDIWLEIALNGIKPAPGVYSFPATVVIDGVSLGVRAAKTVYVSVNVAGAEKTANAGEVAEYQPI